MNILCFYLIENSCYYNNAFQVRNCFKTKRAELSKDDPEAKEKFKKLLQQQKEREFVQEFHSLEDIAALLDEN